MTTNENFEKINLESKLTQAVSLAKVVSDSHNYKDEGLDEPFIDHCNTSNLLWLLSTLLDEASKNI